jgi:hypothetical protein
VFLRKIRSRINIVIEIPNKKMIFVGLGVLPVKNNTTKTPDNRPKGITNNSKTKNLLFILFVVI